jgi:hypothetical protein
VEKTENQQNKNNEIHQIFYQEGVWQMVAWVSDAVPISHHYHYAGSRDKKKPAVIGWLVVLTKVASKRVNVLRQFLHRHIQFMYIFVCIVSVQPYCTEAKSKVPDWGIKSTLA